MLISDAFAQAAASAEPGSGLMSLLPLLGIFLIFYFLLIRPQAKRAKEHKQLVEDLQKNDEVTTSGGILGILTNVSESYVIVEIAPNIEVTVLKSSVQTLLPKGTLKSIEPPKSGKRKTAAKNTVNQEDKKNQEVDDVSKSNDVSESNDVSKSNDTPENNDISKSNNAPESNDVSKSNDTSENNGVSENNDDAAKNNQKI